MKERTYDIHLDLEEIQSGLAVLNPAGWSIPKLIKIGKRKARHCPLIARF
ncbi:hypothetical protein N9B41_01500 [bacterium]|nr:hypothetical protein [bacterium]